MSLQQDGLVPNTPVSPRPAPFLRVLLVFAAGTAIAVLTLRLPRLLHWPRAGFVMPSFPTHTGMLILSLALMLLWSRGSPERFGLTFGTYRFRPRILLWLTPMLVFAVVRFLGERVGPAPSAPEFERPLQTILFVWIYASLCEEVFTRGLLLGWLQPMAESKVFRIRGHGVSLPVLLCALFFGGMHVVLWPRLGPAALVPMIIGCVLGIIAGVQREETGSLVPAVLTHALFNIGGTLPYWILERIFPRG